jgi:hypothetical protein
MYPCYRTGAVGLVALLGIFLAIPGCSPGKNKGTVKGTVEFFGKKLTAGTVTFQTKDGRTGAGNIDVNGNYSVADAPVGQCTITVKVPNVGALPGMAQGGPKPPGNMPPMRPPGGDAPDSNASLIDPSKIVQIPGKYAKPETSNLNFTVERGENKYDITLSP